MSLLSLNKKSLQVKLIFPLDWIIHYLKCMRGIRALVGSYTDTQV